MQFKRPHNNSVSAVFSIPVQYAVQKAANETREHLALQYSRPYTPYSACPALFRVPDHELENWYQAILYRIGNQLDLSAQERSDAQYLAWLEMNRCYGEEVSP